MNNQANQLSVAAVAPNGKVAAFSYGNKIFLISVESFNVLSELNVSETEHFTVGFLNDDLYMVSRLGLYGRSNFHPVEKRQVDSSIVIESFDSFKEFELLKSIISFTGSGLLIALEERKKIFLYDMNGNKLITEFETTSIKMNERIRLISSFSGEMIAVITSLIQNYTVNFFNIEAKMNSGSLFLKDICALQQFALSPKGNYFAYSDLHGLHVFRISNLKNVWEYRKMNPCDDLICFSFLDEEVIIVAEGGEIKKANFVNNSLEMCYRNDNEEIISLHVSSGKKRILAKLTNGDIVILAPETQYPETMQIYYTQKWINEKIRSLNKR